MRLWEGVLIAAKTVWHEQLAPFPKINATETVVRETLKAETKQRPQLWDRNRAGRFEPVQGAGAGTWDAGARGLAHREAEQAAPAPAPPLLHLQAYSLPIVCPIYSVSVNRQCLCWTHRGDAD